MKRSSWSACFATAVLGALPLAAMEAQAIRPLDTSPRRNLQFGIVLPGLPATVNWFDVASAGQYDIRGTAGAEVRIEFVLPAVLNAPGGATLPLTFGAADGAYAAQPSLGASVPFDPRLPLVTRLGKSGRLYLRLGGTATPSTSQPSGSYASSVTVTVAYTGV